MNPTRSRGDSDAAVPVGIVLLELAVASADPEVALYERAERVARRMVDHDLGSVVEFVVRIVDPIAELLVAARNESFVEGADVLKKFASDEEATGRSVTVALEELCDRKACLCVVATRKGRVVGFDEADVRREVVGVAVVDRL